MTFSIAFYDLILVIINGHLWNVACPNNSMLCDVECKVCYSLHVLVIQIVGMRTTTSLLSLTAFVAWLLRRHCVHYRGHNGSTATSTKFQLLVKQASSLPILTVLFQFDVLYIYVVFKRTSIFEYLTQSDMLWYWWWWWWTSCDTVQVSIVAFSSLIWSYSIVERIVVQVRLPSSQGLPVVNIWWVLSDISDVACAK